MFGEALQCVKIQPLMQGREFPTAGLRHMGRGVSESESRETLSASVVIQLCTLTKFAVVFIRLEYINNVQC